MAEDAAALSRLKEILVELDFLPDKRTQMLRIPACSPHSDFANLDSALWRLAQSERDLKGLIREQELIYFNSDLGFKFLTFNGEDQTWQPVDRDSTMQIPEKMYLKVQLDHQPKGSSARASALASDLRPSRLLKKKLEESGPVAASLPEEDATSAPAPAAPLLSEEERRAAAFEKLFFIDDDEEAEKQVGLASQPHLNPSQPLSDSDEDDDRLMIDEDREEDEPHEDKDIMDLDNDDVDLDEWKQMLGLYVVTDPPEPEEEAKAVPSTSKASDVLPRFPNEPVQRPVAEVIPFKREPDLPEEEPSPAPEPMGESQAEHEPAEAIANGKDTSPDDEMLASEPVKEEKPQTEIGPVKEEKPQTEIGPVKEEKPQTEIGPVKEEKLQTETEPVKEDDPDLEDGEILSDEAEEEAEAESRAQVPTEDVDSKEKRDRKSERRRSKKSKKSRRRDRDSYSGGYAHFVAEADD
eukprot:maker-scaffold535_size144686-snap-gene-0.19 protein:Tk08725 transcript:maker-scaffold535_size144686-snap-gene-0.19-mRNA-1 annotation:"cell division protein"